MLSRNGKFVEEDRPEMRSNSAKEQFLVKPSQSRRYGRSVSWSSFKSNRVSKGFPVDRTYLGSELLEQGVGHLVLEVGQT